MVSSGSVIIVTAIGYGCAVVVAAIVTISAQMLTIALASFDAFGWVPIAVSMLLPALVVTFVTALPGFLVTVWLQRRFGLATLAFFASAGAIDALLALLLFDLFGRIVVGAPGSVFQAALAFFCIVGGIAGSLVYRLVSVRLATALDITP